MASLKSKSRVIEAVEEKGLMIEIRYQKGLWTMAVSSRCFFEGVQGDSEISLWDKMAVALSRET